MVTGRLKDNAKRMPLRQHEDILVFYKKQPVYHPQVTPVSFGTEKSRQA